MNAGTMKVEWDGQRVWVNGPDGMNRARYHGKLGAIDIHHDAATQIATGEQCLACGIGGWPAFVALVKEHLGVDVPENAKPVVEMIGGNNG